MNPLMDRCDVKPLRLYDPPQDVTWRGRTYHVTETPTLVRTVGRWWTGEPARTVWILRCGSATLEICRFDDAEPLSEPCGWWLVRIEG